MDIGLIIAISAASIFAVALLIILFKGLFSEKSMEKQLTKMGNAAMKAQANILKNNEDIMRESANKTADIHKDAVETIAHALKDGFTEDEDNNI